MATRYGKRIVTDGLVLCLDAADNISAPHSDLPVKQGLLAWWDAADDSTVTLSGSNVTQWRDKSGNDLHMVPIGTGPTRSNTLNSKSILTFTTSQDVRNSDSELDLRSSDYTILIVSRYVNSGGTTATNRRILDGVSNNWLLGHWNKATSKYYASGWVSSSAVANNDNTWRIYTGDGNISADNWNIFANGTSATNSVTAGVAGPYYLAINSGQSSESSECEVAELIVFNRVLSSDERTKVHNYLQNKWNIEVSDAKWYDRTANNNIFTIANGSTYLETNKGYFELDGTNQYALMTNSTQLASLTTNFTVEALVKFDSSGGQYAIFSKGANFSNGWLLYVRQGPQFSFVGFDSNTSQTPLFRTTSGGISTGTWYHVAYTYDQSYVKAYIDGSLELSTAYTATFANTNSTCYIGYNGNVGTPQYWDGNIAFVRVYNKALSSDEVLQNYNATKGRYS